MEVATHDLGAEFTWMARDPVGQIAAFCAKSAGPVPAVVLAEPTMADKTYEVLDGLAPTSYATTTIHAQGESHFSYRLAERGVFAFDWDPNHSMYVLICKPTAPLLYSELRDREAKRAIAMILFGNDFSTVEAFGFDNLAAATVVDR